MERKKKWQPPEKYLQALQERRAEQQRISEEIKQLSSNLYCRVCNKASTAQVICRKYGGAICMKHCADCEYHQPMFWHCLYRAKGADKK